MKQALIFVMVLTGIAAAQTASKPDPAKAVLEKVCAKCHELDGILKTRNTKERWSSIVDEMVSRGAEATDEQIDLIVDYLAANYGRNVNINKVPAETITGALGISKDAAAAIVAHREKHGAFKTWDDLTKVPGIDVKALEAKKDRIEFGEKEQK